MKLLDFGVAKAAEFGSEGVTPEQTTSTGIDPLNTGDGLLVGTVTYMSPEQARGEQLDRRSDLFSLGILLYEMASGEQPFVGRTQAVFFDRLFNGDPPPLGRANPALPFELVHVIEKALRKSRRARYQSAGELLVDLQRIRRKQERRTALRPLPSGLFDLGTAALASQAG